MAITMIELESQIPDSELFHKEVGTNFQHFMIYRSGLVKWTHYRKTDNPTNTCVEKESLRLYGDKTAELLDEFEVLFHTYKESSVNNFNPCWHLKYWIDGLEEISISGNMGNLTVFSNWIREFLVINGFDSGIDLWLFGVD